LESLFQIRQLHFSFLSNSKDQSDKQKIVSSQGASTKIFNNEDASSYRQHLQHLESKSVKTLQILRNKNIQLNNSQKLGIVGPSGSGKSLTFYSSFLLVHPVVYTFVLNVALTYKNKKLHPLKAQKLLGPQIGFIFQEALSSFHPYFKTGVQFHYFLKKHNIRSVKKREQLIDEWLDNVSLNREKLKYVPADLSGGMLQRISIAMALSLNPEMIIADEATSALDVTTQASIMQNLENLTKKNNTAVIFISHNLELVKEFCDDVIEYN